MLEIELQLFLFVDLVFLDQIKSIWTVQSYPLVLVLNKPSRLITWLNSVRWFILLLFFFRGAYCVEASSVQWVAEFSQDLLFDWMLPSLSLLFVTLLEHLNHNFRLENANTKILKKVYLTEFRQFKSVSILVKCCQRQRALHCFTGGCNIHNF